MKCRNGFVSNSSASSFIVEYKRLKLLFGKPKKDGSRTGTGSKIECLVSPAKLKKLQKYGFIMTNDDEEQIYSVFRAMTSQLTISQVSDAYAQLYSSDFKNSTR